MELCTAILSCDGTVGIGHEKNMLYIDSHFLFPRQEVYRHVARCNCEKYRLATGVVGRIIMARASDPMQERPPPSGIHWG